MLARPQAHPSTLHTLRRELAAEWSLRCLRVDRSKPCHQTSKRRATQRWAMGSVTERVMDSTKLLLLMVRLFPVWVPMNEVCTHIRWQDSREEPVGAIEVRCIRLHWWPSRGSCKHLGRIVVSGLVSVLPRECEKSFTSCWSLANIFSSPSRVVGYCAVYPPSTINVCPVTNEAASEQSQTTAAAISSGLPRRFIG